MSLEEIANALGKASCAGDEWTCRCPAHDDNSPSLSLSEKNGKIVFHCHAGCSQDSVLNSLKERGLWTKSPSEINVRQAVAVYRYLDEAGNLLYEKVRYPEKKFSLRRPDGKGGKITGLGDTRRVLYELPRVIRAIQAGQPIIITEGEKDVHTLERLGFTATTNFDGAGKWRDEYTDYLKDARVFLCGDNDDAGQKHIQLLSSKLDEKVAGLKVIRLPKKWQGHPIKDVSDWIAAGGTKEGFIELAKTAGPPSSPASPPDSKDWELEIGTFDGKQPKRTKWLWPGMIPEGELTILYGKGGTGKSTLATSIISILSNGGTWPTGEQASVCTTLLCEIEDNQESTTLARLIAQGTYLPRVKPMTMAKRGMERRPFSLREDLPRLERLLAADPDIRLVILSAITNFIDVIKDNALELRAVLTPLVDLSHRTGVAFLGIAHPRKGMGGDAVDALAGSHVWSAVSRSVLLTCVDPDDESKANRYIGQVKGNLCRENITLSYNLESVAVECDDGEQADVAQVTWGTEVVSESMESIFQRSARPEQCQAGVKPDEWLREILANGRLPYSEIELLGRERGLTPFRLRNTLRRIGGVSHKEGFAGKSFWSLSEHPSHSLRYETIGRMEGMEVEDQAFEEI